MSTYHDGSYPRESTQSGGYPDQYPEKAAHTRNTSKRYLWRLIRLGGSLALAIAALVLTLIILIVGRHGNASSDLALLTVDMTDFARFNPPTITLVDNASKLRRGTPTRSWIDSAESSVEGVGDDIGDAVSSGVASATSAVASAADSAESAVSSAIDSAEAEADKIVDAIGDSLEDIAAGIEGLMDKVLDTIQDELNKWLKEAADTLNDLDISRKMSLHLTTSCSSKPGDDLSSNSTSSNSTSSNSTVSNSTTCRALFSSGETNFNATANDGEILGFKPGDVLAKALSVFFIPADAQQKISAPVDSAANTVQKLLTEAETKVSAWSIDMLFAPIVAVYVLAAFFTSLLLLVLVAAIALTVKGGDSVPPKVYSLCATIAALATFFLFLGSVILTVIALVAYIVGLGGNVVGIVIESGSRLKWLSWAAFIIMVFVTLSLKVEEFVADCVFWWNFLSKLLRSRKSKDGVVGAMREVHHAK